MMAAVAMMEVSALRDGGIGPVGWQYWPFGMAVEVPVMEAMMEKIGLSAVVEVFGPATVMAVGHSGTAAGLEVLAWCALDGGPFGTADGASGATSTTSSDSAVCSSFNIGAGTCVGNGGIGADGDVAMDVCIGR